MKFLYVQFCLFVSLSCFSQIVSTQTNPIVSSPARFLLAPFQGDDMLDLADITSSSNTLSTVINQADGIEARRIPALGNVDTTVKTWTVAQIVDNELLMPTISPTNAAAVACTESTNFAVNVCSPAQNASATSPVHVVAAAKSTAHITAMQIYLDHVLAFQVVDSSKSNTAGITTDVSMTSGTHSMTVKAWDSTGRSMLSTPVVVKVKTVSGAPTFTQQPVSKTVTVGQTATFSVVVTGTAPLAYQWQKNAANITGATKSTYTTPATVIGDGGSQFRVLVKNAVGSVTSGAATLTVNAVTAADVLTYHNDNGRTGQNLKERTLTPANVNQAQFGKIGNYPVNGRVDAQPLYAANVAIPSSGTHNLLIVATEHASVYAFDAGSGAILWQKTMLAAGESPSDDRGCSQVTPEIGVTSTPVIDRSRGTSGVIYVVAMSKNGSTYHHRLHALDLATGAELFNGPKEITASFPGTGDGTNGSSVVFDPKKYKERAALLLMNGTIHTSWASHCDSRPYTGWLMSYNAGTLVQTAVLNITPNGNAGAIWMAGAGLAGDSAGNYYFLDGNGSFGTTLRSNGFPANGNFGNAFMKISTSSGKLVVADYFEMFNGVDESNADQDLGSGGAMVLPDLTNSVGAVKHLAVGVGKDAHLYVVDRDNMGKFRSNDNSGIYQDISGVLSGGVFAAPAYFNGKVYYGAVNDFVKVFPVTNARFSSTSTAQTPNSFGYPGATPSVSANGTSNGIVWAVQNGGTAVLHAYDAINLNEIYNSNQAGSRDHFGTGNKYITPTIVNGKVFVGTTNSVAVFGLLP